MTNPDQSSSQSASKSHKKKHGLLNKMRQGLRKLTITKTTSEEKHTDGDKGQVAKNANDHLLDTREARHPKSATFKTTN